MYHGFSVYMVNIRPSHLDIGPQLCFLSSLVLRNNVLPYQAERQLFYASRQGINVFSWQNNTSLLDNTRIPGISSAIE